MKGNGLNNSILQKQIKLAPIALFTYNRPWHTKQTIEALKKNELANKSELFIFSDFPKNKDAEKNVKEVRKYLKMITGFKSIKIIKRKENFGLAKSIISGVTKIVKKYGKIIVLEDDIVTSKYFLKYMNKALDLYKDENKVASISGYIYPIKSKLSGSFFLKKTNSWGWATWKRAWDLFEENGQKLLNELKEKKLEKEFEINGSYPFTKMLKDQIKGKNDSWAIQWYASIFLKNKLVLYPKYSLVQNVGFDDTGIHCDSSKMFNVNLSNEPVSLNKIPIKESKLALKEIKKYFRDIKLKRIISRIKREILSRKYKLISEFEGLGKANIKSEFKWLLFVRK